MRERRAYWCPKCADKGTVPPRVFLARDDPVPECKTHGKLERQVNKPYFGRPT